MTSDQEKASVLSDFFSSVFTVEAEGETPQLQQRKITRQMDDEEVTDDEVRKLLKGLNLSKSPELDGLHPHVLKKLVETIVTPLKRIFNTSLRAGKIPSWWKKANILT